MTDIKKNYTYQTTPEVAAQFRRLAEGVNKTPGTLVQELVLAMVNGDIKLPHPTTHQEIYK